MGVEDEREQEYTCANGSNQPRQHTYFERNINGVEFALLGACLKHITGARKKVVAKLVEAGSHNTVSGVEGLLDTVAMVHVNVNVEHSRMVSTETHVK